MADLHVLETAGTKRQKKIADLLDEVIEDVPRMRAIAMVYELEDGRWEVGWSTDSQIKLLGGVSALDQRLRDAVWARDDESP